MMNFLRSKVRYFIVPLLLSTLIVPLIFLAPAPNEAAATLDTEPTRKAEIIIQSSKVSGALTDFPTLLTEDNIPSEACDADGVSPAQNGGGDIRFTSDENGNNQLPLQVVKFATANDPVNCDVEIYVKVPSVSSAVNTSIWMWYNTATTDSQPLASSTYGSQNVWDSSYKGVWHLSESSSARGDSTANGNNLTDNNTVASAAGKWGTAADIERDNSEYLDIADASQTGLDITGGVTVSAWVKLESDGYHRNVAGKYTGLPSNEDRSYILQVLNSSGNKANFAVSSDGTTPGQITSPGSTNLSTGTWYYLTGVYEPSTRLDVYVNGTNDGSNTSSIPASIYNGIADFDIGAGDDGTSLFYDGLVKEVRVSSAVRSSGWISTEYNNQNDPATFAIEQAPEDGTTAPISSTVVKSDSENLTNSTALQDDDEFTFSLKANTEYVISGAVFATSTSSQPDTKIGFTTPSGATMDIGYLAQGGNTRTAELLETSGGESSKIDIPGNENTIIQLMGSVVTGGTAGNLRLQWAQNSSNATATTIKQGSFITVTEVTE